MFSKFQTLEPEKQERILNAAMKEFAQKGYKHASTNEIVAAAGISKGLLFHYFNNKKDLYLFLYDYILEIFLNEFFERVDWNEKDVFIRIRQVAGKKIEIVDKHPLLIDFALAARWEESPEVKIDLEHRNKEMSAFSLAKLFEDIDTSLFKEGVDIRRAIDVIIWTIDGYANRRQEKIKTDGYFNLVEFEDSLTELDVYLGMLKDNFYRET